MSGFAKYTKIQGYQIRAGVYVPVSTPHPPFFPPLIFLLKCSLERKLRSLKLNSSSWKTQVGSLFLLSNFG